MASQASHNYQSMSSKIGVIPKPKRGRASCPSTIDVAGRTSAGLDEEGRFWGRASKGNTVPGSPHRGSVVSHGNIFFALDLGHLVFRKIQGGPILGSLVFKSGSRMSTTRVTLKKLHSRQPFFIQHLIFMHITAVSLVHFIAHVYLK